MENKYIVVYSNVIRDMKIVFEKLKNGLYFYGNENGIILYNTDVEKLYKKNWNWEEIDKKYMVSSLDDISYDYLEIMKQTKFYNDNEIKELEKNFK